MEWVQVCAKSRFRAKAPQLFNPLSTLEDLGGSPLSPLPLVAPRFSAYSSISLSWIPYSRADTSDKIPSLSP